jgi:hypothetical protein
MPEPLDYCQPAPRERGRPVLPAALAGLGIGVLVNLFISAAYIGLGGGRSGDVGLRILFPYLRLAEPLARRSDLLVLLLVLGMFTQYPVLGAALGIAAVRARLWRTLGALAVLHGVAVIACFF